MYICAKGCACTACLETTCNNFIGPEDEQASLVPNCWDKAFKHKAIQRHG